MAVSGQFVSSCLRCLFPRDIQWILRCAHMSFNLSTKASNPARSDGLSGGPCVNLVTYFEAIVKGCPNRSSSSSLTFQYPRDESITKQHLMVSFATPDVY